MSQSSDARTTSPRHDAYDVIVIGGGIGGLTAGAVLANAGFGVLLVNAGSKPGGLVSDFEADGLRWEPAVHPTLDPPHWHRLLDVLGVADQVEFTVPPYLWRIAVGKDLNLAAPFGAEPYIDAHVDLFPRSADQVRAVLSLAAETQFALHKTLEGGGGLRNLQMLVDQHPEVMKYRTASLAEVLEVFVDDPEARAVIGLPGLYLGLPPSRLSFAVFSQHLFSHAADGAGRVVGGIQHLLDTVAGAIDKHGGEQVHGRAVDGITVADGRVTGVRLEGGDTIAAKVVVSNADPISTMALLGDQELPAGYQRKLRRGVPSDSTFNGFFATNATLEDAERGGAGGYSVYYSTMVDLEAAWQASFDGRVGYAAVAVPTLLEGRAEGQPHQLVTTTSAPFDAGRPWKDLKAEYAESAQAVVEELFPGTGNQLVSSSFSTPETIKRFTRNHQGAQYGWGNGTGARPLDQVTPIEGLYLASGWTSPGSGFLRSSIAGRLAAAQIGARAGVPVEFSW